MPAKHGTSRKFGILLLILAFPAASPATAATRDPTSLAESPGASAIAAEARALVNAELLADVEAVAPGRAFHVGVRLRMRRGWHIYWKRPGDAGLGTAVELKVPKGFAAGPIRWKSGSWTWG